MSEHVLESPGPQETQVRPQGSYRDGEYPKGEWVHVCYMLRKKGRYKDADYYFTGRAPGCTNIRWIVKPRNKRDMRFRRIPREVQSEMFELGYWQNITDCADSKHRSNISHR